MGNDRRPASGAHRVDRRAFPADPDHAACVRACHRVPGATCESPRRARVSAPGRSEGLRVADRSRDRTVGAAAASADRPDAAAAASIPEAADPAASNVEAGAEVWAPALAWEAEAAGPREAGERPSPRGASHASLPAALPSAPPLARLSASPACPQPQPSWVLPLQPSHPPSSEGRQISEPIRPRLWRSPERAPPWTCCCGPAHRACGPARAGPSSVSRSALRISSLGFLPVHSVQDYGLPPVQGRRLRFDCSAKRIRISGSRPPVTTSLPASREATASR